MYSQHFNWHTSVRARRFEMREACPPIRFEQPDISERDQHMTDIDELIDTDFVVFTGSLLTAKNEVEPVDQDVVTKDIIDWMQEGSAETFRNSANYVCGMARHPIDKVFTAIYKSL